MTFSKNGKHPVAGASQRHPRTLARRAPRLPDTPEWKNTHARIRACGLSVLEANTLLLYAEGLGRHSMARRLARSERQTWVALATGCDKLQIRSRREARALVLCFRSGEAWGEEAGEDGKLRYFPLVLRSSIVAAEDLTRELDAAVAGV